MTGRLTMATIIGADRCPFCGIGTAKVFEVVNTWACPFCHKTGDLFTWVIQRDQIDFKTAVERLLLLVDQQTPTHDQMPRSFPVLTEEMPVPGPFHISGPQATIVSAVSHERRHQDRTHGTIEEHPHTVGEWLLIIETELLEAKTAWVKGAGDRGSLLEILQVIASGFACLEQHGVVERTRFDQQRTSLEAIDKIDPYGGTT